MAGIIEWVDNMEVPFHIDAQKFKVILILILLLGLSLRLYHLEFKGIMGGDQGFTLSQSKLSITQIIKENNYDPLKIVRAWDPAGYPPLHFIVLHYFMYLGDSIFVARLPSVIFGVLTILLVYMAGKTFFGPKEGLVAAFLYSVSPFDMWFSQLIRGYTMFAFLSILSAYLFYKILLDRQTKYKVGFILSTVFLVYTHYYGIYVLFVEILFISLAFALRISKIKKLIPDFTLAFTVIFVLIIPALAHLNELYSPFSLTRSGDPGGIITSEYLIPSLGPFISFGISRVPHSFIMKIVFLSASIQLFALLFFATLLRTEKHRLSTLFLILMISIPLLTMPFLIAIPYEIHYLIFILPFYLIAVSKGIVYLSTKFSNRVMYFVLISILVIIILPQIASLHYYYSWPHSYA